MYSTPLSKTCLLVKCTSLKKATKIVKKPQIKPIGVRQSRDQRGPHTTVRTGNTFIADGTIKALKMSAVLRVGA